MTVEEAPVVVSTDGRVGHLLLNRPKAINALTHEMVGTIQTTLEQWVDDPGVETILLTGSGERGLCAGGDIVALYRDALAGGDESARFWADEYRLNATIADYPKPFVAVMDGLVLGGGIGLSAHADLRIVTEHSSIGMPETGIGFLPDVGGTHLLARAPGELGTHLALTGGSVAAGDALAIGLADWYVPSEKLPALIAALPTTPAVDAVRAVAEPAPDSPLSASRSWIDEHYRGDDVASIVASLESATQEQARAAAAAIGAKSPTSVVVTLQALRRAARTDDLRSALDREYRLAVRLHARPDFAEGIRAQVIDKDRTPQWSPRTIADVSDVDALFAPLPDGELGLAGTRQEHLA